MHMINIISIFRMNRDSPVRKALDFEISMFHRVIKLFQSIANQVLRFINRCKSSRSFRVYVFLT